MVLRCCLSRLDSGGNVKVGDFGLTEDVYVRGYFRQDKSEVIKVPFRWMAPESLRDGLFSQKSDVVNRSLVLRSLPALCCFKQKAGSGLGTRLVNLTFVSVNL